MVSSRFPGRCRAVRRGSGGESPARTSAPRPRCQRKPLWSHEGVAPRRRTRSGRRTGRVTTEEAQEPQSRRGRGKSVPGGVGRKERVSGRREGLVTQRPSRRGVCLRSSPEAGDGTLRGTARGTGPEWSEDKPFCRDSTTYTTTNRPSHSERSTEEAETLCQTAAVIDRPPFLRISIK